MVMPNRNLRISESLIGIGAMVLKSIGKNTKSLDDIVLDVNKQLDDYGIKRENNNIDNIILTIDFLYTIGAIESTNEGNFFNIHNRV